ncbi:hypothetical protein LB506_010494 [Fusarium annulatum]|nr:hypothetical protein LB506_010494 [Fusarium annulatum]
MTKRQGRFAMILASAIWTSKFCLRKNLRLFAFFRNNLFPFTAWAPDQASFF